MPLIAFTSPKGGVGKTTLAAHVAALLARRGHKVVAVDLDPQNALRVHLGVPMGVETGFLGQIDQKPDWRQAVLHTPARVDLLAHGSIDPRRSVELATSLYEDPDLLAAPLRDMLSQPGLVVVVDTPPGPSAALEAVLPLSDLICLVLLSDAGSAAMMPGVVSGHVFGRGTLAARFIERMGVVMNQVNFEVALNAAVMECALRTLGPKLLAAVCTDELLAEALAEKRLLTGGEPGAGEDLQVLADKIVSRLRLPAPGAPGVQYPALTDWGLR